MALCAQSSNFARGKDVLAGKIFGSCGTMGQRLTVVVEFKSSCMSETVTVAERGMALAIPMDPKSNK